MVGTRVYVGKLPYRARERDVEKFFKGYGKIREIILKNGFGFVEFDDTRDAEDAAYELNGKELCGERVLIELARGMPRGSDRARWGPPPPSRRRDRYGPPTRTDYRIRIENLSSRISWQDLKDMFRAVGDVSYADAHTAKKNEGVVEFSNKSDMKKALEKFDGYEVKGRKLKLSREEKRKSRSRSKSNKSRSRSRSRSRSGRRSRSSRRSRSRSRKSGSGSRSPVAEGKGKEKVDGEKEKSKSKSKERERGRSRSGSRKSASRSKSRSKSHSKSRSKSHSKSRSHTPTNADAHSDSEKKQNGGEVKEDGKMDVGGKSPVEDD